MQNLDVVLIQSSLFWESYESNIKMFEEKIDSIIGTVDLIILPEMFTSGFSMNPKKTAMVMDGHIINWFIKKSLEKSADIVGTVAIKDEKKYYNRLIWANKNGKIKFYDKKHLFSYVKENIFFTPGKSRLLIKCNGWKICPFVCYDLRFPLWNRNFNNVYDLAIYLANWPDNRANSWKILLTARAIENLSYVVGVNRVGIDGKGINYAGDSLIIGPDGVLLKHIDSKEAIVRYTLSYRNLKKFRNEFPFWVDADAELVSKKFYQ